MQVTNILIVGVVGAVLGAGLVILIQALSSRSRKRAAEVEARRIIEAAAAEGREEVVKAKDESIQLRERTEKDLNRRRGEMDREEERLQKRRVDVDRRFEKMEQREQGLNKRQSAIDKKRNEIEQLRVEQVTALERVSEMNRDEAREHLLAAVEQQTRNEMARKIREIEAEVRAEADERARELVALSIQRIASDQVSETTVSVVPLPSDDMKGRIIGRNGRNIRAFEQASGVDVVVDDTPEAVTISSFDPVRREVARRALSKLVLDGRIHPARIEKLISDSRTEVDAVVKEEGERAAYEAGVPGLHPEIIKLLGRLKFRTSYGQNQHAHSIESAHLAGILAAELGADVAISKAGGLLHDLGKAIDHEVEGTHAAIGAEWCKRYGVGEKVVNCIASHHHEVEQNSVEAIIVEAADAISGARPGARRESLELYLKRVKTLEALANSFEGVSQSYALQAGREVRIIVRPEEIDDLSAIRLSKDIAKKIEEDMQYPGQVKVTVIRETRAVDYAK
jgi:ribonuclease Y